MACGYPDSMIERLLCIQSVEPARVAVADTDGAGLTYEQLYRLSTRMAKLLSEDYGVGEGDVVAVTPINKVEAVQVLYSTWLLNAAAAVIDPLCHSEDLEFQLGQVKPKVLVTHEGMEEKHCPVAEKLGIPCATAEELSRRAEGGNAWEGYARPRSWTRAVIYFYAGIAGRTMPVIHSHSTIAASAYTVVAHYGLEPGDTVFVPAPLSHALGLQVSTLSALYAGGTAILYTKRGRLNPSHAAVKLAESKARMVLAVPSFYSMLLEAGYRGHKGLEYPVSAGAPLSRGLQEAWRKLTGTELLQLYGMTEAAPLTATLPDDNPSGSIGKPMPGVEVRIVDPDNPAKPLEGGAGELLVRGPMVMMGYGESEETMRAILPGGWLRTGDIVEVDGEGHFYFRGVRKRMIKYKGYPIFPRDLEIMLEKHPAVARALVEGEPAGEHGQVPVAKVWLKKGARVTREELLEWVNSRVAGYKRLRRLEIVGEL